MPTKHDETTAEHDREQVKRVSAAMKCALEQANSRADAALDRLRAKATEKVPAVRLVKKAASK